MVRADAAGEQRIAIEQQVLRRDRRADAARARSCTNCTAVARRDVLEHDAQLRKASHAAVEHAIDEDALAIEDVHRGSVTSPCTQQRHTGSCHRSSAAYIALDARDAGVGMRRGARGIELDADERSRSRARRRSRRGVVVSVRYSVISGSKRAPAGSAARMRSRYARA